MRDPRLDAFHEPAEPRASILMFHAGQEHSTEDVSNRHASWWRMAIMARSLRRFATENDLSLRLLQYRVRGWNGSADPAPVRDARWALDRLQEKNPAPVVLVGHSMGGRTACHVADDPAVTGVVALAPWLPRDEPNASMAERHLHVIHGTNDRWTSAQLSREYVDRSRPVALSATWTALPGAGHFMLSRLSTWNGFVRDSIRTILDEPRRAPGEPTSSEGRA
jgi:pimeloyl-ACP methyl ester carboxylesterase